MSDGPYIVAPLKQVVSRGATHRGTHRYYHEFDSLFSDLDVSYDDEAAEIIEWHKEHTKGSWSWEMENRNITGADGQVVDVKPWLVLSFDLSGDAMLSRMTWPDLKRYPVDAKCRGRTGDAS